MPQTHSLPSTREGTVPSVQRIAAKMARPICRRCTTELSPRGRLTLATAPLALPGVVFRIRKEAS